MKISQKINCLVQTLATQYAAIAMLGINECVQFIIFKQKLPILKQFK